MTNQELIDRALIELGVLGKGESADATDSADALAVLNQMMAAWRVSDKDLQFFPQDTLSDTVPIPTFAEKGVISSLAVDCAAPFNAAVTQALYDKQTEGMRVITRTLMVQKIEQADMTHLPLGEGNYGDILSGP